MAGGGSQNLARGRTGLAGEVARMEEEFTLAWFVTRVGTKMSPVSSRGGAGRRWPRAALMSAMHGRRRMVRGPARFTGY
jgi:hypothetical protein